MDPTEAEIAKMDACDVVAGMSYDDEFTLRGKHYTVRDGGWTFGDHRKGGEYVTVPVWSPSTHRASTVSVRTGNKLSNVKRRRWS